MASTKSTTKSKSRATGRDRARIANRWVASVKTDSTHPPEGLFKKNPSTVARELASQKVSPKGPASGLRMLTYFINRAGKGLTAARRKELERAKALLSHRVHADKARPRGK